MTKYCSNCGKEVKEEIKFCTNCGNKLNDNSKTTNSNYTVSDIIKKDIAVAIILSIVTCGIYTLYWFATITDDINTLDNDNQTSGGMALLLTIITCGIYGIYWVYKLGQRLYKVGQKYNKNISDNSIIYLVLQLFGFGIVNYALIQNDINSFSNQ